MVPLRNSASPLRSLRFSEMNRRGRGGYAEIRRGGLELTELPFIQNPVKLKLRNASEFSWLFEDFDLENFSYGVRFLNFRFVQSRLTENTTRAHEEYDVDSEVSPLARPFHLRKERSV